MLKRILSHCRLFIGVAAYFSMALTLCGCATEYGSKFQELGTLKDGTFREKEVSKGVYFCQGQFSDLDGAAQNLSLLVIDPKLAEVCLGYVKGERHPTSVLAKRYDAIAAVNGGYFNYTNPVTPSGFFKENSTISNANPAEVVASCGYLYIDPPRFYGIWTPKELQFDRYRNVFWSYPILLKNGEVYRRMGNVSHIASRHARTAFGIGDDDQILLLVVDKASAVKDADGAPQGMTCLELAKVMEKLDVRDAINLDGGGSSTMYVRDEGGLVNVPSDQLETTVQGERPVYTILYVLSRQ